MRSLALVIAAVAFASAGCGSSEEETCDAPPPQLLGAGCDGRITMGVADDGIYWVNPCDSSVLHATSPDAVTVALRDPSLEPFDMGNLLVTPADFYVSQYTGLNRYPRDGSAPAQVLSTTIVPTSIVLVNDEVVWMNAGAISAQPANGGQSRVLDDNPGNPDELLSDPARQRVYWLNIGTGSTYSLRSSSLAGDAALSMDSRSTPDLMAQDDAFLYWAASAHLERASKDLNAPKETLPMQPAIIRGLTVTSDAIYVLVEAHELPRSLVGPARIAPSRIHRLSLDGKHQAVVACNVDDTFNGTLTEHDGHLYWLGGRGVWTAPIR